MSQILNETLSKYIEQNTSDVHPYLLKIERDTHLNVLHSHMVSGSYQAKLLQMLCLISNPTCILEIGTFTGFATMAFAEVIKESGKVITVEADKELFEIAKQNIFQSPWSERIVMHLSQANDIIPEILLENNVDMVFIDADKKNNINYYNLCLEKLKSGALIITDNVLWKGNVLHQNMNNQTKLIHEFNVFVSNDSRVEVLILPVRDGLSIARKK